MATTAGPYGMLPVKLIGGQPYAGSTTHYSIANGYATSIFYGDVVKLVTSGVVEKDTGTATATPVGVFLGCAYTDSTYGFTTRQYWPASTVATDAVAYVCDDPDVIFQIQADDTVALTAMNANFALVQTAGSTATGNSKVALDASSVESTATLPIRLVGFVSSTTSSVGDTYTDCYVKWNFGMHQFENATGLA